jgi:hypothetical protein
MRPTFVRTESGSLLVQVSDPKSRWGFYLADEDDSWDGGFGIAQQWVGIPDRDVSAEEWRRLGYLLECPGSDRQDRLRAVWDELNTQVYRVLDDEGEHIENALARRLPAGGWLYVDEKDGYQPLADAEMAYSDLETEEEAEEAAQAAAELKPEEPAYWPAGA